MGQLLLPSLLTNVMTTLSVTGAELISEDGGFLVFGLPDIDATGAEAEFFNFVQMGIDRQVFVVLNTTSVNNVNDENMRNRELISTAETGCLWSRTGESETRRWRMYLFQSHVR